MTNVIDVFTHFLPPKYLETLRNLAGKDVLTGRNSWMNNILLTNIEERLGHINQHSKEIISNVSLFPEMYLSGKEQILSLYKKANLELSEIVSLHSDRFLGCVANIPLNDVDGALEIINEQVNQNDVIVGIQIYTPIDNENKQYLEINLDKVFEKMNEIGKPIWLHPIFNTDRLDNNITFSWEYELTLMMQSIIDKQYFNKYPDLKIIVHHAGAMVPYFAERIRYIQGENKLKSFQNFYVDTALLGNTQAIELAISFFGISHVLFGTDAPLGILPFGPTDTIIKTINETRLSPSDKRKIFVDNWFTKIF
ncbi:amidohydrolase family protein [Leuconostoc pseudomesenteroides]|uniref:amidohydrolase family protein n=1 Tax=Leuconostoc pseudomesenteroides TaxID=33968 RepID=UPI00301CC944